MAAPTIIVPGIPPALLGVTQYATPHTYTTTSATPAAVDSTNLTVSFTAPASGNVLIMLAASGKTANTNSGMDWGVGPHGGSLTAGTLQEATDNGLGTGEDMHVTLHYVTGLTPGARYQYDWFWCSGNGSTTVSLLVGAGTTANGVGPAIMTVLAA